MTNTASALDYALQSAGIPITGVSIGNANDKNTWRVDFTPEATTPQRDQADAIIADFDIGTAVSTPSGVPEIFAVAQLSIADGEISGVEIASKFAGAFVMDVGSYYMFFTETLPDTRYLAKAYDGGLIRAYVREEDKTPDYFVITVTDMEGAPTDVGSLSVEVIRVN